MTKAFIFGALVFPLVAWGAFPIIMALTKEEVPRLTGTVAIIDATGEILPAAQAVIDEKKGKDLRRAAQDQQQAEETAREAQEIAEGAGEMSTEELLERSGDLLSEFADKVDDLAIEAAPSGASLDDLKAQVANGEYLALAIFTESLLRVPGDGSDAGQPAPDERGRIEFYSFADLNPGHSSTIKNVLQDAVVHARAARLNMDVSEISRILREPGFDTRSVTDTGEETTDAEILNRILPFAFMGLIFMAAFSSGQYLLTTTIEEKSNKVMEVLLSAVSPMQIMTGKILGQGMVSLIFLVMYGGLGVAALAFFASLGLVNPWFFIYFAFYFVIAYLMIASVMAAVGSAVNDLHEAQTLMMPIVMIFVMGPFLLMMPASQSPNGMIATVASFIPPFMPYVMMVRITAGEIPIWQIAATSALGLGSMFGALWLAAKIFRVGILMTGKPPSPLEMLKWIRYA